MSHTADYLDRLVAACHEDPRITGLVLFGSSADRARADEWSDHDFAVIAHSADIPALRGDLSWLPGADRLVVWAQEHHDGFKAIDDRGGVIEFAVTDLAGLGTFFADSWHVAYGGADVRAVMASVADKPAPDAVPRPDRDVAVFLTALLVGVGRARRGEVISANGSVRSLALHHLLLLLKPLLPPDPRLDTLDPSRRFEFVHPELGARLGAALARPIEACARELLAIADGEVAPRWVGYPHDAVRVVRTRLGWAET
jgi:hypothetical protein